MSGERHLPQGWVSKSVLQEYVDYCARKVWYRYMEDSPIYNHPRMTFGKQFHEGAAEMFMSIDLDAVVRCQCLEDLVNYFISSIPMMDYSRLVIRRLKEWARVEAENFWYYLTNFPDALQLFMPIILEEKVYNEEFKIYGMIDRVNYVAPGEYCVIEYKGGFNPAQGRKVSSIRREWAFYARVLDDYPLLMGGAVTWGGVYNPVTGAKLVEPIKKVSTTWMLKGVARVQAAIALPTRDEQKAAFERKAIGMMCVKCPHRLMCKADKVNENGV